MPVDLGVREGLKSGFHDSCHLSNRASHVVAAIVTKQNMSYPSRNRDIKKIIDFNTFTLEICEILRK